MTLEEHQKSHIQIICLSSYLKSNTQVHFPKTTMQSKVLIFAITASLASAAKFGNSGFTGIAAGTPFEINWIDALGPVAIKLKSGPATALNDVAMIGSEFSLY